MAALTEHAFAVDHDDSSVPRLQHLLVGRVAAGTSDIHSSARCCGQQLAKRRRPPPLLHCRMTGAWAPAAPPQQHIGDGARVRDHNGGCALQRRVRRGRQKRLEEAAKIAPQAPVADAEGLKRRGLLQVHRGRECGVGG
jgi:hypothetical protein